MNDRLPAQLVRWMVFLAVATYPFFVLSVAGDNCIAVVESF
jgi:hypothetical protein